MARLPFAPITPTLNVLTGTKGQILLVDERDFPDTFAFEAGRPDKAGKSSTALSEFLPSRVDLRSHVSVDDLW